MVAPTETTIAQSELDQSYLDAEYSYGECSDALADADFSAEDDMMSSVADADLDGYVAAPTPDKTLPKVTTSWKEPWYSIDMSDTTEKVLRTAGNVSGAIGAGAALVATAIVSAPVAVGVLVLGALFGTGCSKVEEPVYDEGQNCSARFADEDGNGYNETAYLAGDCLFDDYTMDTFTPDPYNETNVFVEDGRTGNDSNIYETKFNVNLDGETLNVYGDTFSNIRQTKEVDEEASTEDHIVYRDQTPLFTLRNGSTLNYYAPNAEGTGDTDGTAILSYDSTVNIDSAKLDDFYYPVRAFGSTVNISNTSVTDTAQIGLGFYGPGSNVTITNSEVFSGNSGIMSGGSFRGIDARDVDSITLHNVFVEGMNTTGRCEKPDEEYNYDQFGDYAQDELYTEHDACNVDEGEIFLPGHAVHLNGAYTEHIGLIVYGNSLEGSALYWNPTGDNFDNPNVSYHPGAAFMAANNEVDENVVHIASPEAVNLVNYTIIHNEGLCGIAPQYVMDISDEANANLGTTTVSMGVIYDNQVADLVVNRSYCQDGDSCYDEFHNNVVSLNGADDTVLTGIDESNWMDTDPIILEDEMYGTEDGVPHFNTFGYVPTNEEAYGSQDAPEHNWWDNDANHPGLPGITNGAAGQYGVYSLDRMCETLDNHHVGIDFMCDEQLDGYFTYLSDYLYDNYGTDSTLDLEDFYEVEDLYNN